MASNTADGLGLAGEPVRILHGVAALEPITTSLDGVAGLLDVSAQHVANLMAAGKFGPKPIRLGRSVRFIVSEIREWCAAGAPPADKWQAMRGRAQG